MWQREARGRADTLELRTSFARAPAERPEFLLANYKERLLKPTPASGPEKLIDG